jgi:hypothetical protein
MPLYRSLEECLKHPSCVSTAWIDAISEVNNPQALNHAPYKDGSLHWVDNDNQLLNMDFPTVLDLEGEFSKIGPYFNHMGEHEARVSIFKILFFSSLLLLHYYFIETIHQPASPKPKPSFNFRPYRFFPPKKFQPMP